VLIDIGEDQSIPVLIPAEKRLQTPADRLSTLQLDILRAVGGLRGQVRRTIWIEAISIGTLGLILGFGLGAVNLYYTLKIVHHDIAGMRLDYTFPLTTVLALVPVILGAAFVAALWPAEAAVRGSLVEALEYE